MKEMGVHNTADLVVHAIRSSLVTISPEQSEDLDAEPEPIREKPVKCWAQ
jgi:hypothetical protein